MIDCPICHVMNEDMARFCAECGQRLTKQSPPTAVNEPAPPVKPEAPRPAEPQPKPPKLHSPLLGADANDFPTSAGSSSGKPDLSRLRGTSSPSSSSADTGSGSHMGLRSPLLGGVEPGLREDSHPSSPSASGGHLGLRSPLLGGVDPGQSRDPEPPIARSGKKAHLHSPLLEGDDEDVYEDAPPARPPGRGKLKSPLLAGDDDDYPQPRQSASGGLRSPLLSGSDSDSDQHSGRSASGKHHLRSPLLGGEDDDQDEPPRPLGRSGGLRSPILGSAETVPMGRGSAFVEVDDDDQESGGDHVLRSPLLASKVPMHDKPVTPKSQKTESAPTRPAPSEPSTGADSHARPQSAPEPSWGGPSTPSFGSPSPTAPPPASQPAASDFGMPPAPRPPAIPPQAVNSSDSFAHSGQSANIHSTLLDVPPTQRFGTEPPGPGPARLDNANSSSPPGPLAGSPMSASVPAQNKPMAGPGALLGPAMAPNFEEPVGGATDSSPSHAHLTGLGQHGAVSQAQAPSVNMSSLRGMGGSSSHEETDAGSKKRRFKPAEDNEPAAQEIPDRHTAGSGRFSGQSPSPAPMPQPAALPGFIKLLALPALFAAVMKTLVLMDWLKTPQTPFTVIGDQIGQLLVCITLIIICVTAGNSRS